MEETEVVREMGRQWIGWIKVRFLNLTFYIIMYIPDVSQFPYSTLFHYIFHMVINISAQHLSRRLVLTSVDFDRGVETYLTAFS